MKANKASYIKHFPELYDDEGELNLSEDKLISLSIFNHWLSEEDAAICPIMNFAIAVEAGRLSEYLKGEISFLDFYYRLSEAGVVVNSALFPDVMSRDDPRLSAVFTESLRETRAMDAYFIGPQVRVVGGYDRTDLLILEDRCRRAQIEALAQDCGLFVLHRNE